MALAQGVLDIAINTALQHEATRIIKIKLLIGAMTHVEPESLKFGFSSLAAGTIAAEAELEIELTPFRGQCTNCGKDFSSNDYFLVCPGCGSHAVVIKSGRELCVEHLEVE